MTYQKDLLFSVLVFFLGTFFGLTISSSTIPVIMNEIITTISLFVNRVTSVETNLALTINYGVILRGRLSGQVRSDEPYGCNFETNIGPLIFFFHFIY